MEKIRWNIVVFIVLAIFLIFKIIKAEIAKRDDHSIFRGLETDFFLIMLFLLTLIWGGIFWW